MARRVVRDRRQQVTYIFKSQFHFFKKQMFEELFKVGPVLHDPALDDSLS
jgi:hypothetical protein